MPAVSRTKTYTKTRKTEYNHSYSSSSQNSFLFPITGASTAIDSLLAKNIEKRNSSIKETNKKHVKKGQKEVRLLENDSFDLTINTTFEKLQKQPAFQPVNYCNISLLAGNTSNNSSTNNSHVKNEENPPFTKVQKTYGRGVKTNVLSLGKKIKNKKTDEKNLRERAKKIQKSPEISPDVCVARKFTPIASTSKLATPKLITPKINSFQPGRRHCMQAQNSPNFLAASTPLVSRQLRSQHDFSISPITAKKQLNFKSGWKSLFESDSLPNSSIKNNHSTVPDIDEERFLQNNSLARNDLKFNSIPIVLIEDGLQLNTNTNTNKRKLPVELGVKVYSPRVDLTRNSFSKYAKKIDKFFQSPYIDLTRHTFSDYLIEKKQKQKDVPRHSDVNKTDSINMNLRSRSPTKTLDEADKLKQPVHFKKTKNRKKSENNVRGIGLRTRSHRLKINSDMNSGAPRKTRTMSLKTKTNINDEENRDKPVRRLRSTSAHLINSSSENNLTDSVFINNEESPNKVEENGGKRVLRTRSKTIDRLSNIKEKTVDDEEKNKIMNDESIYIARIIAELKKPLNITNNINTNINTNTNTTPVANPVRRSSRTRRKSVLIDEENYSDWGEFQRITQNKFVDNKQNLNTSITINSVESSFLNSPIIEKPVLKRRTRSTSCLIINESNANTVFNISDTSDKSLFSSASTSNTNDVIENTINETSKAKKFITTRRGSSKELKNENFVTRRRGNSKSSETGQTISLHEWERFSQNNISTIKIDDVEPSLHHQTNEIIESSVISDTFAEDPQNIFLKPGKQWFRSLSILRRTNIHNIQLNNSIKGRKWRDSVCAIFDQQDLQHQQNQQNQEKLQNQQKQQNQQQREGVLIDTTDNQHNEIYNLTKNFKISRINSLNRRTTLQIVPIATARREVSVGRNVVSILEESQTNKTGYVSTLADESQSILASFDKLSLTTNVDEREETARQIILKRCGQTNPLPFDDCYSQRLLTRCRKIGEGVYGEVFMYKSLDKQCRVMKIIPIEGNLVVNGEHQKKFEEIISEIIIASELSNLRNNKEFSTNGFNELLKICCVQGKYPQHLLDLWNLYDEEQGSENDSPEIFADEQLYIVLELANGGQDLEAYRFNNAEQSFAVFAQVVCSLAVAESALQFEHRDMHWGNLLISATNETTTTFRLNGRELEIATKGVNVSIIDFTLSRMTYNNCCIFNDLALDPDLFTATGDYQFDIYRLMRQRNLDDWQRFEPYSNIVWLDYTLEKMITQLRYLRINTKTHKTNIRRLTQMRKKIFNYNSATELLNSDAFSQVFLY